MTWILTLFFFVWLMYVLQKTQVLLVLFFQVCKMFYWVYCFVNTMCNCVKVGFQRFKRYYLLKTKKFEDRVVMQPPNLSTVTKKKF